MNSPLTSDVAQPERGRVQRVLTRLWMRLTASQGASGLLGPLLLIGTLLFNIVALLPSLANDSPNLNDHVFHLLNLQRTVDAFRAGQDPTDAWQRAIGMGFPIFHYYQHLPYLIPAIVHLVSGVGMVLVFRWTNYLLLCVFPLSMYWAMRKSRFDRTEAGFGALVSGLIATNGLYGLDLTSYIWSGYGLYTQLWGMVLLPPALAACYVVMRDGRGYGLAALLDTALQAHLAGKIDEATAAYKQVVAKCTAQGHW